MIDKEKILKGLFCCSGMGKCIDCPYKTQAFLSQCTTVLAKETLELLKEQEAVEPKRIDGKRNHFIKCGNCDYDLLTGYLFCPHCGRKVNWE